MCDPFLGASVNAYERKQEERRARLEAAAARTRDEATGRLNAAHAIGDAIPMGQPILVGHHSEGKHRSALRRMDRHMRAGVDGLKEADALDRAAAGVGTGGISSDDPEAVIKLRAELVEAEAIRVRYKAINKAVRADAAADPLLGPAVIALALTDKERAALDKHRRFWPGWRPGEGFSLTNLGANIRRLEKRIEELLAKSADVTTTWPAADTWPLEVVDDVEGNRLRIKFPGDSRPSDEIKGVLRGRGFVFSPSSGCWQRKRSSSADYAARIVVAAVKAGRT